jgi:hypothetical protein
VISCFYAPIHLAGLYCFSPFGSAPSLGRLGRLVIRAAPQLCPNPGVLTIDPLDGLISARKSLNDFVSPSCTMGHDSPIVLIVTPNLESYVVGCAHERRVCALHDSPQARNPAALFKLTHYPREGSGSADITRDTVNEKRTAARSRLCHDQRHSELRWLWTSIGFPDLAPAPTTPLTPFWITKCANENKRYRTFASQARNALNASGSNRKYVMPKSGMRMSRASIPYLTAGLTLGIWPSIAGLPPAASPLSEKPYQPTRPSQARRKAGAEPVMEAVRGQSTLCWPRMQRHRRRSKFPPTVARR